MYMPMKKKRTTAAQAAAGGPPPEVLGRVAGSSGQGTDDAQQGPRPVPIAPEGGDRADDGRGDTLGDQRPRLYPHNLRITQAQFGICTEVRKDIRDRLPSHW